MRTYFKNIIFTKTPLNGYFKFKKKFQVYPIDLKNSPRNINARHFPCIIEFWVDDKEIKPIDAIGSSSVNKMIAKTTAQTNKILEITNLLSTLSNYRFFHYRNPDGNWSMPIPETVSDEINNISSQWSISLFYYPNMATDLKINEFSIVKSVPIKLFPKQFYYFYDPVENSEKDITFPNNIELAIENYFKLNANDKIVCESAIYQFCNGLDLYSNMKSLSFISIVNSIETLVNHEFKDEIIEFECNDCKSLKNSTRICKRCGKPIWGVTAKFRDFLFKYVSSDPKAKKVYNSIYNIRSKIAHTEYLISGENYLNWNFDDKTEELGLTHLKAIQLARRSISSWQINRTKKEKSI